MKLIAFAFLMILVSLTRAQSNTEIYLFNISKGPDEVYALSGPINITENEGYDNQPTFWPDGNSILYARTVTAQTEIARYYIGSGKTTLITNTLQGSEYSPTPTPEKQISSIRLDTTGLQLLYTYDFKGNAKVLVPEMVIGYHCWIDKKHLAAFVLGEPNTLQLINLKSGKTSEVARDIGRSLQLIPGTRALSYVDKSGDKWIIKALDTKKKRTSDIVRTIEGSEDFCWTPMREILMGKEDKLWMWHPQSGWKMFADLSLFGLKGASRLAISPNGELLAVVVEE